MNATGIKRLAPAACGLLAGLVLALVASGTRAAEPAPLFASDDVLDMTLAVPLRTLIRGRTRRPEVEGTLSYTEADGAVTELDVEVRTRGRSRLELCSFPPLSVNLRRGQVAGMLFDGQNRLKLVTLCRDTPGYREYLELEYVIYRMYEQVSDFAYRVRPLRVQYLDSERGGDAEEAPAFFIEHQNGIAERVGMQAADVPGVPLAALRPEPLATYALFQYVIGNTDWSAISAAEDDTCCHNGDVLTPADGSTGAVVVPYDFDQAGLINTAYAAPHEDLPIRSVTQRLFRGFCATNELLDATVEKFNTARPAMEALLDAAALRDRTRADALQFLAGSYEILNDPEQRQREIVDRCRG